MAALDRVQPVDLAGLMERTATAFSLGAVSGATPIEKGYEDCNVWLSTSTGQFVAKIFDRSRSLAEVERYVDVVDAAMAAGCTMPEERRMSDGELLRRDPVAGVLLVVMEHVEGADFDQLGRVPTAEELQCVAADVAKLHRSKSTVPALFDSWAVPNIAALAAEVEGHTDASMRAHIDEAVRRVMAIDMDRLPHALVHGDLTQANVRLRSDGVPVLLDFSVANICPRVQELAVMAANLMYDGTTSLQQRCERIAAAYGAHETLTDVEQKSLFDYAVGATAMEYLGSLKEKHLEGNDNAETDQWLELGRDGLLQALR